MANDVEAVKRLLASSKDPFAAANELDELGQSPLFVAVSSPTTSIEIIRALLEAGADTEFEHVQRFDSVTESDIEELAKYADIDQEMLDLIKENPLPNEFRVLLMEKAVSESRLEVIKLLVDHGGNIHYTTSSNSNATFHAACRRTDPIPVLEYLIEQGCPVDNVSIYGESPVSVAYHSGKFELLDYLLRLGADDTPLGWNPLMRAVSLGTLQDVTEELSKGCDLSATDRFGRTAFGLATLRGNTDIVKLLSRHHTPSSSVGSDGNAPLCNAVESGSLELVEWLITQGEPVDSRSFMGETALCVAASLNNLEMVKLLLRYGADPNAEQKYESIVGTTESKEIIETLLAYGMKKNRLKQREHYILAGIVPQGVAALASVSWEQYQQFRHPVEGKANPEEMTNPYWVAMIRAGINAYQARSHFKDSWNGGCFTGSKRGEAVWCNERFGQSFTALPDGRCVFIGGEHEDSYDPDFFIYNDVFVVERNGDIRIFVYPYSVFPPTDFHSATLVGNDIYIIGCLGYWPERKHRPFPVYKLSTSDFRIEHVPTHGDMPASIYDHVARLVDDKTIEVSEGKIQVLKGDSENMVPNDKIYRLDISTLQWTSVTE